MTQHLTVFTVSKIAHFSAPKLSKIIIHFDIFWQENIDLHYNDYIIVSMYVFVAAFGLMMMMMLG